MFVNTTLDQMLEIIENAKLLIYCYQIPASVGEALTHGREDYAFWINYPCQAQKEFYEILKKCNGNGIIEWVEEAIGNATIHGNKGTLEGRDASNGDPLKAYSIKLFAGEKGVVVRIRNEGIGFAYEEVIEKYKQGKPYATHGTAGGNGMRILDHPRIQASYEDKGRATNIMYLL